MTLLELEGIKEYNFLQHVTWGGATGFSKPPLIPLCDIEGKNTGSFTEERGRSFAQIFGSGQFEGVRRCIKKHEEKYVNGIIISWTNLSGPTSASKQQLRLMVGPLVP